MVTSHDIRHWVMCSGCHEPGDKRNMIPTDLTWWHATCYVIEYGEERFLSLPASHVAGVTLNDIGLDLMRKLVNRVLK